jgi:hypothetical protein
MKETFFFKNNQINSKGRFAAVCAARSGTPNEQQINPNTDELCSPPTPCPSIRDRQVLNRTPNLSTNHNPHNLYYAGPSTISPQPSSSASISEK